MSILVKTMALALAGVALGLFATAATLQEGFIFGAVRAGPWISWPKAGAADADPYSRAVIARSAEVPLGQSEGLSFVARSDSAGRDLRPECDYLVSGPMPTARFWTLSVLDRDGRVMANPMGRRGFTSSEILRDNGGGFSIVLSRSARPGNWLPLADSKPYLIMLRLYDSANSSNAESLQGDELPSIVAEHCA